MRVHTYGAHPQTPELEDELRSSESSKNMTPLLGGESALRRNRNPADCNEEKECAEEACSVRDVGCPAEAAKRQVHEGLGVG